MDLLNLSRPWDCEGFPKSKTICYGGGGGGGGIPTPKVELPKITTPKVLTDIGEGIKKKTTLASEGASSTIETVKKDVSSGIEKKKTLASEGIEHTKKEGSKAIEDAKTGASSTIESVKKDVAKSDLASGAIETTVKESDIGKATSAGIENIKKEGTKATEHIKKETQKLASGDYSLKKSIQGTASGVSETFKKSDAGKVVKKIAKETGYTGSDFDKTMQKAEKETANVINQTLDVVDQPGKYVAGKLEEFKQYAAERLGYHKPDKEKTTRPRSTSEATTGPGSAKTMGQGNIEGLKGGGALASSDRSRIRQNKRKLRIARA